MRESSERELREEGVKGAGSQGRRELREEGVKGGWS